MAVLLVSCLAWGQSRVRKEVNQPWLVCVRLRAGAEPSCHCIHYTGERTKQITPKYLVYIYNVTMLLELIIIEDNMSRDQ